MTAILPTEETCKEHSKAVAEAYLQIVDPLAYPGWDSLVATHPDATFFHSATWAKTLADSYGFGGRYIAAIADRRLCGLLPIIEARSWLKGTRGVSLPFADECAPLVSPGITARSLIEAAMREGESRHWKYLELRGGHELLSDLPQSVSFYGHKLNLKFSAEHIFQKFESSVQRAIRKAERAGITVRFAASLKAVEDYYRLHCQTRLKHGAPPQPFRFFRSLFENALQKGRGFVALAMLHDRPIAGAVFLEFQGKVVYKFAASDERYQEYRGSNLVVWESIKKLVESGASELNFGKTALSNDGLRRFKSGWGAEEYLVQYARYSFEQRAYLKLSDLAVGPQARVFALLPAFLCRWIGRAAYPHMS